MDRLEVSHEVGRRFNTAGKQELLQKYSIVIIFNSYIYKQKNNQKEFMVFFYVCHRTFLALSACCFLFPQGENETQPSTSSSSWV